MKYYPAILGFLYSLTFFYSAHAAVSISQNCGKPAPIRQTIILLDSAVATAENKKQWLNTILDIADALKKPSTSLLPYERLNLFVLDRQSEDIASYFTGCSANISDESLSELKQQDSFIDTLLGTDSQSIVDGYKEKFYKGMVLALGQVNQQIKTFDHNEGSFENSLLRLRNSVKLSDGIPRVFLITDLNKITNKKFNNKEDAGRAGIELGKTVGIDFSRAEMYVINLGQPNPILQTYLDGFLLASKAYTHGARNNGIPKVDDAPVQKIILSGRVQYGDKTLWPVQIRVAIDSGGNLVNSWISIAIHKSEDSPFRGKYLCNKLKTECTIEGDGTLLGQAWNPSTNKEMFSDEFPWAGFRYIQIGIKNDTGNVKIFQPGLFTVNSNEKNNGDGKKTTFNWDFEVNILENTDF